MQRSTSSFDLYCDPAWFVASLYAEMEGVLNITAFPGDETPRKNEGVHQTPRQLGLNYFGETTACMW